MNQKIHIPNISENVNFMLCSLYYNKEIYIFNIFLCQSILDLTSSFKKASYIYAVGRMYHDLFNQSPLMKTYLICFSPSLAHYYNAVDTKAIAML